MNAAETLFAFDDGGRTWISLGYGQSNGNLPTPVPCSMHFADWHSTGNTNCSFYDGHAKMMPIAALFSTNAGTPIVNNCGGAGSISDASNRATVGPNPFWTAAGEQ
jgi:prepilin-type processing-associated H-X9-DG protein